MNRAAGVLVAVLAALALAGGTAALADTFIGTTGNDTLTGTVNPDQLYGEDGDDTINAGAESDYIEGGPGNDTINAGTGSDLATGGTGDDLDEDVETHVSVLSGTTCNDLASFGGVVIQHHTTALLQVTITCSWFSVTTPFDMLSSMLSL